MARGSLFSMGCYDRKYYCSFILKSNIYTEAGSTAELAASRKEVKYQDLTERYAFVLIAIESLGPLNSKATSFLSELGRRITAATSDVKETTS